MHDMDLCYAQGTVGEMGSSFAYSGTCEIFCFEEGECRSSNSQSVYVYMYIKTWSVPCLQGWQHYLVKMGKVVYFSLQGGLFVVMRNASADSQTVHCI